MQPLSQVFYSVFAPRPPLLELLLPQRADVDLVALRHQVLDPPEFVLSVFLVFFNFLVFGAVLVFKRFN
jgi:hypothetical protein